MTDFAKQILPINIEDELKTSYLSYAMKFSTNLTNKH